MAGLFSIGFASQVKGNVGQIKSLTEENLECDTKEKLLCFLEDLGFSIHHDYVKDGYVFLLLEKGSDCRVPVQCCT